MNEGFAILLAAIIGGFLGAWATQRATRITLEHDRKIHQDNLQFEHLKSLQAQFIELFGEYNDNLTNNSKAMLVNKAQALLIATGDTKLYEFAFNAYEKAIDDTTPEDVFKHQSTIKLLGNGLIMLTELIKKFDGKTKNDTK